MNSPSFFAIISDIHANIDALEAVLADIERWPCRGILCIGDIVGYGPEPATCVQRVMDTCAVTVLGNHEAMLFVADQFPADDFMPSIGEPIKLALDQLSEEQKSWLRNLPISADLSPLTLSHTSLHEPPSFHYIHDKDEAKTHFAAQTTFVSFQGHTHVPLIWEMAKKRIRSFNPVETPVKLDETKCYAINVGSVGQPRDNDPRACYVLYDYEGSLLLHRRVEYDIPRAQTRFKQAGLPTHNANRLKKGQ